MGKILHRKSGKKKNRITPRFTKTAPKDAIRFFDPHSDDEFKAEHPIGYVVFVIAGIIAFLLPLLLYCVYLAVRGDESFLGGWPVLAFFGSFVMGVGLFNVVAAFLHQYLGHKLTAISLLSGGALVGFSIIMTENPHLYDENISSFYFISLLMMLMPAIFYLLFRFSVNEWLKRSKHISRTKIKKLIKEKKNFWWYETLHREVDLGLIYYLNKSFTIVYILLLILTLLTGFIKIMSPILCVMNIILYLLTDFIVIFWRVQDNLDYHKKPIVLFARSSNGGIDSIVLDIAVILFVIMMAYVNVVLVGDIWGIEILKF